MVLRQIVMPRPVPNGTVVCTAENLTFARRERTILHDVSLEIRAGEVLAVVGPNGAGKSTLLGLLSGDLSPEEGNVQLFGHPIDQWSLGDLSRRRSVLLQDNPLFFPFTVQEVVEMGRAPWHRTEAENEDEEVVSAAMQIADVSHLGERKVPTLSGGERARTALARVLAGQTSVLLLDEPTAALDLGHQEKVLDLMRQRAAEGNAVLVILHDLNAVANCADRIALLSDGTLAACGTAEQVFTSQTLSDVYKTPVEVIYHPVTGRRIILPVRG